MLYPLLFTCLVAAQADSKRSPNADWFSDTLANAGDLDGDGRDDLLIGDNNVGSKEGIAAFGVSAATGELIATLRTEQRGARLAGVAPVGDVDEDGKGDLAIALVGSVSGKRTQEIQIRSGATGEVLRRRTVEVDPKTPIRFEVRPSIGGGTEGTFLLHDGEAIDLVRASDLKDEMRLATIPEGTTLREWLQVRPGYQPDDPPAVIGLLIEKGATGQLHEFHLTAPDAARLSAIGKLSFQDPLMARANDVDGDDVNDLFLVHSPGANLTLAIASRTTGKSITSVSLKIAGVAGKGARLIPLRDLDGDGFLDVMAPIPQHPFLQGREDLAIPVFSGKDLSKLFGVEQHADPESQPYFGHTACALGDVTGDDVPDFAIGAYDPWGSWSAGRVEIRSGADGSFVRAITRASL